MTMTLIKPKIIPFEKIKVGMTECFSVTVTAKNIREFAKLSGDRNPLHTDARFAKTTRFKKPIAHGMLLASFFSRLVGMHLPGRRCLYLGQSLKFKRPVYPGEKITVFGAITAKQDAMKLLTIKTVIKNKKGEVCVEGEAQVLYQN